MEVRAAEISEDLADEGNQTSAEQWLPTPLGWSAVLYGMRNLDDALEWLERMFDETGLENTVVRGGPSVGHPKNRDNSSVLTAHLAIKTDQSPWDKLWLRRDARRWATDPRVTSEMAEQLASWCHLRRGRDYVLRDGSWYVLVDWEDAGPGVADAVEHGTVIMSSHLDEPVRHRVVNFDPQGFVGIQDVDPAVRWEARLSDLLKTIHTWAHHCDYAFVAPQSGGIASIEDVAARYSAIPTLASMRHLLAEFVPAPFGTQVVTGSHLAKAHNLDNWTLDDLGRDRYLLTSKDLESWFKESPLDSRGRPIIAPPDVVAAAHEDFGDMVITPQLIQDRPAVRPARLTTSE